MRGNLFIKIFLGFWFVSIAVFATAMLSNQYFDDHFEPEPSRHPAGGPPHRATLRLIYQLQNASDEELSDIIAVAKKERGVDIFLLNHEEQDLLGRNIPIAVSKAANRVSKEKRRAFIVIEDKSYYAHKIYREAQGRLRAVLVFPGPKHSLIDVLGTHLWLRLLLAVLVSGLICFALSKLVTNRLRSLQLASRKLAQGELDTRLEVREKGGDETDELSRDFNSMAEQLQQRILAQKRLMGDVSHELRSPLARLRVALAMAQDDPANSSAKLQRIEHETQRLESLIEQLLSLQPDSLTPDRQIDLVELLRELCSDANFEAAPSNKQVQFKTDLPEALIDSSGDLLHKSFDNIIRNALHYTEPSSTVTVSIKQQGNRYRVSIQDYGPGVPEAELALIFDEFYRVDTARTRESGGYGLGLAIAQRAILRHGGNLQAFNTEHGLQVIVTLPYEAANT